MKDAVKVMQKFENIKSFVQGVMSEKRFAHTMGVAEEARRLAEIWGVNPEKAYLAGLIHDVAKELPFSEAKKMIEDSELLGENDSFPDSVSFHGFMAVHIAKTKLNITDEDVLNAARYHTTGRVGMSLLEKIIYVADFTEQGRPYPEAKEVREISENNLDAAVLREADHVIKFIIDSGRILCTTTVEVRNSFLNNSKRG